MARFLFKNRLSKAALAAFFLANPVFGGYNVIKEPGFEEDNPVWRELQSNEFVNADRHFPGGHESDYSGLTSSWGFPPVVIEGYEEWCYLEQELVKRKAKDYDLEANLRWFLRVSAPRNMMVGYDYWYFSVESQENKLIYLYAGTNAERTPQNSDKQKVVKLFIPTADFWKAETLNFYEDWTEKFSEDDEIERIKLASYSIVAFGFALKAQSVLWDDLVFWSTRFDHDVATLDIFIPDSVEVGESYMPIGKFQNKGAFSENFDVICDISYNDSNVYSDTLRLENILVDSTREVNFRNWTPLEEGLYNMTVYTALAEEQNPENDSLSKWVSAYTGVEERASEPIRSLVAFPNPTRGLLEIKGGSQGQEYELYDASGRLVDRVVLKDGRLDLTDYSPGVYFLKGSGPGFEKVVIIE